jgi:Zn-dependent protease with chaperone function
MLYTSVVNLILELGERIGLISYSLTGPICLALQYWSRRSELSADRCAAAVAGEHVFQRMLMKLASGLSDIGADCSQFVRQAEEYHRYENVSWWNKIQQNCRMAFNSHPQMVNRAHEIDRWKK